MSLAKKCDICGKLYEHYTTEYDFRSVNGLIIVFVEEDGEYGTPPDTATDCCPECMKAIIHYIDGLKNGSGDESKVTETEKKPGPGRDKRCDTCIYEKFLTLMDSPCQSCKNYDMWRRG